MDWFAHCLIWQRRDNRKRNSQDDKLQTDGLDAKRLVWFIKLYLLAFLWLPTIRLENWIKRKRFSHWFYVFIWKITDNIFCFYSSSYTKVKPGLYMQNYKIQVAWTYLLTLVYPFFYTPHDLKITKTNHMKIERDVQQTEKFHFKQIGFLSQNI